MSNAPAGTRAGARTRRGGAPASPSAARWSIATFAHIRGRTAISPSSRPAFRRGGRSRPSRSADPRRRARRSRRDSAPRFESVNVPPREVAAVDRALARGGDEAGALAASCSASASRASRITGATTPSARRDGEREVHGRRERRPSGPSVPFSAGTSLQRRATRGEQVGDRDLRRGPPLASPAQRGSRRPRARRRSGCAGSAASSR